MISTGKKNKTEEPPMHLLKHFFIFSLFFFFLKSQVTIDHEKKVIFQWAKRCSVQEIVHLRKQILSWPVISEKGKEFFCNLTVFLEHRPGSGRETPEPVLTLPGKRNKYYRHEKE